MKYCSRCILPDTRPTSFFDRNNICDACNNFEKKKNINWKAREVKFKKLCSKVKKRKARYDCLIPVSGGKDSHWQVITALKYNLNPLCLTFAPSAQNSIGNKNLENLKKIGVDHVLVSPNFKIEKKFIYDSFKQFGSTAIPVHMGMFQQSFLYATKFKIPLIIWGENAAFEYGSKNDSLKGFDLNQKWFKVHGNTFSTDSAYWEKKLDLQGKLTSYYGVSDEEMKKAQVKGIFLGYYFRWDPLNSYNVAKKFGFTSEKKFRKTGYYFFSDLDDNYISIHHYMKYFKFGFSRIQDNLSIEIRNGRLSRAQAIKILKKIGYDEPREDIKIFCENMKISINTFKKITEKFLNKKIWVKNKSNKWKLKNSLI